MLKQSTARNLMVLMTSSTDHITGATGLSLTITASKNGAAFASITPTVTERGDGWYSLALTTSHTDTLGDFVLHVTASGADPTDVREEVFASLPGDSVTVSSLASNSITAASIAADAVTEIQSGLATSSALSTVDGNVTAIKAKTDDLTFTVAGQVDANTVAMNSATVYGNGSALNLWRGTP
jgi:hypothetical protein